MIKLRHISLLLVFLLGSSWVHGQASDLVDSLAVMERPEDKMTLALRIAYDLQSEDWKRTLYYLNIAEKQATEIGTEAALSEFHFEAGAIFQGNELIDLALDHYQKAYDHFDPKNPVVDKFRIENNLGILYARRQNVQKALFYFNEVLMADDLEPVSRLQILNNIGNFLIENHEPDSAIVYLSRAESIARRVQDPKLSSYVATNQARAYTMLSDDEKAGYYFGQALTFIERDTSNLPNSWVYVSLTSYYSSKHLPDSAIKYASLALHTLQNRPRADYLKTVTKALYQAYLEKDDYRQATNYFMMYDSARDVLISMEKEISTDRLQLVHEFEEQLRIKNLESSQRKSRMLIIGLAILSALILLMALVLRYRAKLSSAELEIELSEAKRKELRSKLELKEKKLVSETMIELTKTAMTEEVLDKLKKIKRNARKVETRNEVDLLINQITREQKTDIWKEFDAHFTEIHETFYKRLHEKHDGLTSRDMRLCALLKINLTTKEIADLAGQSIKGVENARVRLRKKLNLTNTGSDISTYLNSISQ